jgi:type IV fimbrial biogenesis protein FimT
MTVQRGFTLGETLMSLAVAAVALSLAAPGLEAITRSNRQAVSVNELVSTLHLARSTAVTRNAPVGVCASRDGETCKGDWQDGWIAFVDQDASRAREAGEAVLDRVPALGNVTLSSRQYGGALLYRANGRAEGESADSGTGEFLFCAPGAKEAERVVIVRASGLPALSAHGRDGSPAACRNS